MPLMDEKGMLWMKQLFLWMKQLILWMGTSLFRVMDQKVILWMKRPNLWKKKIPALELGESYACPECATPAAEALMRLRHLSSGTHICSGSELIQALELE